MECRKNAQQNTNNNGKFSSLKLKKSLKIPKPQSEPVIHKKTDNTMTVSWNYCLYVEIDRKTTSWSVTVYNKFCQSMQFDCSNRTSVG